MKSALCTILQKCAAELSVDTICNPIPAIWRFVLIGHVIVIDWLAVLSQLPAPLYMVCANGQAMRYLASEASFRRQTYFYAPYATQLQPEDPRQLQVASELLTATYSKYMEAAHSVQAGKHAHMEMRYDAIVLLL